MTKIAVSSGDPAGIGPDICIKAFDQISKDCLPIFFGNIELFKERAELLRIKINIEEYTGDNKKQHSSDSLKLVNQTLNENVIPGEPSLHSANYILNNFKQSVKRTLDGEFDAIVTCPINKQLINDSGIAFTGHTEELAKLSNTQQVVMMLVNEKIKVALASTHLPIREVPSFLNEELLKEIILITNESLKKNWGIADPLIKVLGLNPHAGDGGHIGKEEQEFISPAINYLKNKGLNIIGPLSADTAFVEKNSEKALESMCNYVENLIKSLEISYRKLLLCAGDLGFASSITYDFEVYAPGQKRWLECSSVSNFKTYQSNRMNLKIRDNKDKVLAHTLNGSALALPRIVAAILETHQDKDEINVPNVLHNYTGFKKITL